MKMLVYLKCLILIIWTFDHLVTNSWPRSRSSWDYTWSQLCAYEETLSSVRVLYHYMPRGADPLLRMLLDGGYWLLLCKLTNEGRWIFDAPVFMIISRSRGFEWFSQSSVDICVLFWLKCCHWSLPYNKVMLVFFPVPFN